MKNFYQKLFLIALILMGSNNLFAQSISDQNRIESNRTTSNCDVSNPSGGFSDGIECNEADSAIAANDILVPADTDLTLNAVMANMVIEEGVTITSATIWIFGDDYGYPDRYPGFEITSQVLTPTSHTLIDNDYGMDFYEVLWDLSPILLEGRSNYATRYWVGISATTSDGSTPYWEVTYDNMVGQPAAYSTGSWFDLYDTSQDGSYSFFADCESRSGGGGDPTDCGAQIASGGFTDGIECNESDDEIAANDILVPAESDLTLNAVMANMVMDEGVTITSATIWVFEDEYGYPYMYPGFELTSQNVVPTSHTLVNSGSGMVFYEVLWDLSPIVLEGSVDYDTRYWIGISATTSDGSTSFWEVTDNDMISQPAAYSTGSWFDLYDSSKDGSYIFSAECEPMESGGGLDPGDCGAEIASDGFSEGIECGAPNNEIVAIDIIVPADSDLTLNAILANMVLDEGVMVDSAIITLYENDNGLPGTEISSETVLPTSHNLIDNDYGMDFYEVIMNITPVTLSGTNGAETTYWVGMSVNTTDGSTPFWEVIDANSIGYPAVHSDGSGFSVYNSNMDGAYVFAANCEPMSGPDPDMCDSSISRDANANGDGQNCNEQSNRIVANDIIVPAGIDMTLNALMPNIIIQSGVTIDYVGVTVYEDANGLPGNEISYELVMSTSETLIESIDGMDIYEILYDIDPVFLAGNEDVDTHYWVGISVTSSNGTATYWEVANDSAIGHPLALNAGGSFSIPNPDQDGVYTFYAECLPISGPTGPNEGECAYNSLEINQNVDDTCFGYPSVGMGQSFIAEQTESSGAGFKFTDSSRGLEVTIGLWDDLPSQGGNSLATKTTQTYGGLWVDVFWDSNVELIEGDTYYLLIDGDADLSCIRSANDTYSNGQAYSGYLPFPDYDLTFRTYSCLDIGCSQEVRNAGYESSFITSKDQSQLVATDITVPVSSDFTLERINVDIWMQPGASLQNADIIFYEDDAGKPGEIINTLNSVVPNSQNVVTSKFGFDISKVVFDIPSQLFTGQSGNIKTYWVSMYVDVNIGSGYISSNSIYRLGYESYSSPDTGDTWIKNEGWDIAYLFEGTCEAIELQPCEAPEIEVNQTVGTDCMINVNSGGAAQSYTAEAFQSAGAGFKFMAPSTGYEVTISLWDALPNNEGTMLASKSAYTTGNTWVDVFWDEVISVTPGEVYYITIEGASGLPCLAGSLSNPYPGGHLYSGEDYEPYPDWDLVFRTYSCEGGGDPTPTCSEENPNDFTFETGTKTSSNSPYLVANDITVAEGETFNLTGITASIISQYPIFNVDVVYYKDASGLPGEEIGSQNSVTIESQSVIGVRSEMDVKEIKLSVDPFLFEGDAEEPTTYWISLEVTDLGNTPDVYWVMTSALVVGNELAQREGNGAWFIALDLLDGVYTWEGDCDVLSVESNTKDGFSFYPNPAKDELNLKSVENIESVAIYNMLGQRVIEQQVNTSSSTIDVSGLSAGAYVMKVSINGQISTYKVLKN